MTEPLKVYRVSFVDGSRADLFFGSIAAIYETLTDDDVGCKAGQLYRRIRAGGVYSNKKVSVSQEALIRKKQTKK